MNSVKGVVWAPQCEPCSEMCLLLEIKAVCGVLKTFSQNISYALCTENIYFSLYTLCN